MGRTTETGRQQTSAVLTVVKILRGGSNLRIKHRRNSKHVYKIWTQIYNRTYIKFVYRDIQPYTQAYIISAHIVVCTRHTQGGRIKRTPLSSGCEQERWLPYKGTRDGGRAGGENWKNNWLLLLAHHSDVPSFSCLGPGLLLVLFSLRLYIYRCTITLLWSNYNITMKQHIQELIEQEVKFCKTIIARLLT